MTTEAVLVGEKRKPEQAIEGSTKKLALDTSQTTTTPDDKTLKARFSAGLFDSETRDALRQSIADSGPYKHGVIAALMDDGLLRRVREEIMANLHFTKKETDIYKLFQTGDLRNLSGLDADERAKLSALSELREALYSKPFREHLEYVTGSGALSGTKQDLAINVYQQGCHLLNHDDVIGSRRISYILYLPNPDEKWEYPKNGGALRLFPIEKPNVPAKDWTKVVPPAWNQMAFFTVQPGLSFHDVEEVYVNKPRMSISGWFHIPQRGEEGFIEGELEETQAKSSLQQLESDELQEYDYPKRLFVNVDEAETEAGRKQIESIEEADDEEAKTNLLSADEIAYLSKYLNPVLLQHKPLLQLSAQFLSESVVEVRDFLNSEFASVLKHAIDGVDYDDEDAGIKVPSRSTEIKLPWKLAGPPHKARYMYLDGLKSYEAEAAAEIKAESAEGLSADDAILTANTINLAEESNEREKTASEKLLEIAQLFKSKELRTWLRIVARLNPTSSRVLVRRFRPALDFTLATGLNSKKKQGGDGDEDDEESLQLLEATLALTPTKGWEDGELGGYELYMGVEEDDKDANLDPAVYRSKASGDSQVSADGGDSYGKSVAGEEDDSVLLTTQASWNVLSLVVRDEGILKFVKYVSGNAPGSRWDVSTEWNVESVDDEDEDNDEQHDE